MIFAELNAYAKINLFLDILSKNKNGYHELITLFTSVSLSDKLKFEPISDGIIVESDSDQLGNPTENIVYKVISHIIEKYQLPNGIRVKIEKSIPIGGGLGGGSSDAAATLLFLNKTFKLGLSDEELMNIGVKFGADVPFFIKGGCAVAGGIGDQLSFFENKSSFSIILVNPGFAVSTKYAYGLVDQAFNDSFDYERTHDIAKIKNGLESGNLDLIADNLYNIFEEPVFKEYPQLREIKNDLINLGCRAALMSGSGSTLFGIIDNKDTDKNIYILAKLQNKYPFCRLVSNESLSF